MEVNVKENIRKDVIKPLTYGYDRSMGLLKVPHVDIVDKINEIIDFINNKEAQNE